MSWSVFAVRSSLRWSINLDLIKNQRRLWHLIKLYTNLWRFNLLYILFNLIKLCKLLVLILDLRGILLYKNRPYYLLFNRILLIIGISQVIVIFDLHHLLSLHHSDLLLWFSFRWCVWFGSSIFQGWLTHLGHLFAYYVIISLICRVCILFK